VKVTKEEVVARKSYEVCRKALPKYSRREPKKYLAVDSHVFVWDNIQLDV